MAFLGPLAKDTGTNVLATGEAGEPNHASSSLDANNHLHSVWWQWTAPSTGSVTINTFGSNYDTTLGVYTANNPNSPAVNALSWVASNDDSGSPQSQVTFAASGGITYYIAVDGWRGSTGNIVLNLNQTIA